MHFSWHKQKGFAPILLLIPTLILTVLGTGYYFFKNQLPKTVSQDDLNSPSLADTWKNDNNPQPISTPVAETSNWKTYTNSKYKYSFKYPSTWLEQSNYIDNKQNIVKIAFTEQGKQYFMYVGTGGRGGPPADEIKGDNPTYNGYKFSRRMWIKDRDPFFIVVTPDAPHSVGGGIEFNIPQNKTQSYIGIFEQILSTFKFIN